jgi:hypothetical protein
MILRKAIFIAVCMLVIGVIFAGLCQVYRLDFTPAFIAACVFNWLQKFVPKHLLPVFFTVVEKK